MRARGLTTRAFGRVIYGTATASRGKQKPVHHSSSREHPILERDERESIGDCKHAEARGLGTRSRPWIDVSGSAIRRPRGTPRRTAGNAGRRRQAAAEEQRAIWNRARPTRSAAFPARCCKPSCRTIRPSDDGVVGATRSPHQSTSFSSSPDPTFCAWR